MDQKHSKYEHLFALIRFDLPINHDRIEDSVSVVKVFATRSDAEAEVRRLSSINDLSKCKYEVQVTRFVDRS
jgi:hypothetical protein